MIRLHHLRIGRSIFCAWALEELGLSYDVTIYERNPETFRAPPELAVPHPLGKSPVIEDGGQVISESAAITQYLIERYTEPGRFAPTSETPEARARYLSWLHFAEGSAFMPLFMMRFMVPMLPDTPVEAFAKPEADKILGYLNDGLEGKHWIMGERLSGADFGLGFIANIATDAGLTEAFPNIPAYWTRIQARDAWQKAVAKVGL